MFKFYRPTEQLLTIGESYDKLFCALQARELCEISMELNISINGSRCHHGSNPEEDDTRAYMRRMTPNLTEGLEEILWSMSGDEVFSRKKGGRISNAVASLPQFDRQLVYLAEYSEVNPMSPITTLLYPRYETSDVMEYFEEISQSDFIELILEEISLDFLNGRLQRVMSDNSSSIGFEESCSLLHVLNNMPKESSYEFYNNLAEGINKIYSDVIEHPINDFIKGIAQSNSERSKFIRTQCDLVHNYSALYSNNTIAMATKIKDIVTEFDRPRAAIELDLTTVAILSHIFKINLDEVILESIKTYLLEVQDNL